MGLPAALIRHNTATNTYPCIQGVGGDSPFWVRRPDPPRHPTLQPPGYGAADVQVLTLT